MRKKEWVVPLTDTCSQCNKKVTDHHWLCNSCWTINQKKKSTLQERIQYQKRCKRKLERMRKKLRRMESDYEQIKKWVYGSNGIV